jgi:hypothetical protein
MCVVSGRMGGVRDLPWVLLPELKILALWDIRSSSPRDQRQCQLLTTY